MMTCNSIQYIDPIAHRTTHRTNPPSTLHPPHTHISNTMSRRSGVLYLGDYDPEADEQDEDEQVSYTVVHGQDSRGRRGDLHFLKVSHQPWIEIN
jgi:hypothetical protein